MRVVTPLLVLSVVILLALSFEGVQCGNKKSQKASSSKSKAQTSGITKKPIVNRPPDKKYKRSDGRTVNQFHVDSGNDFAPKQFVTNNVKNQNVDIVNRDKVKTEIQGSAGGAPKSGLGKKRGDLSRVDHQKTFPQTHNGKENLRVDFQSQINKGQPGGNEKKTSFGQVTTSFKTAQNNPEIVQEGLIDSVRGGFKVHQFSSPSRSRSRSPRKDSRNLR